MMQQQSRLCRHSLQASTSCQTAVPYLPPAAQGQRVINPYEARWFWIVLVANPVVWALSCLSALLGLDWGELH